MIFAEHCSLPVGTELLRVSATLYHHSYFVASDCADDFTVELQRLVAYGAKTKHYVYGLLVLLALVLVCLIVTHPLVLPRLQSPATPCSRLPSDNKSRR
jgi:hypothetical protein